MNLEKMLNPIIFAIADQLLRKAAGRLTASISEDSWFSTEIAELLILGLGWNQETDS